MPTIGKEAPPKRIAPKQSAAKSPRQARSPKEPRQSSPQPSLAQDILALLIKIFVILTVLMILFTFLFGLFGVKDMSMQPTVKEGDIVLFYRLQKDYVASDLVVLEYDGQKQLRRVLAVAGDTVDITGDGLFLNGSYIATENTQEILLYEEGIEFPITVPDGHVFVLGDHRRGTIDSRMYGTVPIQDLLGKASTIVRQRNL